MKLEKYAHLVQGLLSAMGLPTTDTMTVVQKLFTTDDNDLKRVLTPEELNVIDAIDDPDVDVEGNLLSVMTGEDRILTIDDDLATVVEIASQTHTDELADVINTTLDYKPDWHSKTSISEKAIFTDELKQRLSTTSCSIADVETRLLETGVTLRSNTKGERVYSGLRPLSLAEITARKQAIHDLDASVGEVIIEATVLKPSPANTHRYIVKDVHNKPNVVQTLRQHGLQKKHIREYYLTHGVREVKDHNVRVYIGLEPI